MSWSILEAKGSGDSRLDPQVVQAAAQFFGSATTGCGDFTIDFAADLGVQALLRGYVEREVSGRVKIQCLFLVC